MIKRLVALFLVLLLSIESFGAVVSDNDGSAFITKAEFDSLKNDFQSQIDQYNTSIDAKIDGAIASYLAGIQVAKKSNLKSLISNLSEDNKTFRSASWNNYNSGNVVAGDAGIQIVRMRGFYDMVDTKPSNAKYGVYLRILLNGGNRFIAVGNYEDNARYGWWTKVQYNDDLGIYYIPDDYQVREIMHYRASNGFFGSQMIPDEPSWDESLEETNDVLLNENTSPEPLVKTYHAKIVGEDVDYVATTTATFENGSNTINFVGNLNSPSFTIVPSTSYWFLDGDNLNTFTDAKKFSMTTTVYRRNAVIHKLDHTTYKISTVRSWANSETAGTVSSFSATKMTLPLTSIKNYTLSNIVGEPVNLYSGLPMCYLPGQTGKLKFTISLSQDAIVCINYGQFDNQEIYSSDTDYDKNYGIVSAGVHTLELDMSDTKWNGRDDILWIKVNRTNSSVEEITVDVSNIEFETEK